MLHYLTPRVLMLFGFFMCVTALLGAAYLQYVENLQPCALCLLQRWVFIALALCLFLAVWHNPAKRGCRVYGMSVIVLSVVGLIVSGRQVWLQHLPLEKQPECGPGLDFLLENFPLTEALHYVFAGSGECAAVDWTFLGLSLAVWAFVTFFVFTCLGLIICKKS